MTKVIATIGDTEAAAPVRSDCAGGRLPQPRRSRSSVRSDGFAKASSAARGAGIALSAVAGDVVQSLAAAGAGRDVAALISAAG